MKGKPSKPDASRKPGGELPYSDVQEVVGGPIVEDLQGPGLGAESFGITGSKGDPSSPKEKNGPTGK